MNKNHEQEHTQQQVNRPKQKRSKQKRSKRKLILIGSICVACAFLLKRDAH